MRHTPGRWQVKQWKRAHYVHGFETVITDARGHGLFTSTQKGKSKKVEANANLIANAPEMLSALKDSLMVLHEYQIEESIQNELWDIIAKAEGK